MKIVGPNAFAIASGAALRAMAISAFLFPMRYWSREAMLGYGTLASCACACHAKPSTTTVAKLRNAIVLGTCRFIDFS
jgi:hypothetical protein